MSKSQSDFYPRRNYAAHFTVNVQLKIIIYKVHQLPREGGSLILLFFGRPNQIKINGLLENQGSNTQAATVFIDGVTLHLREAIKFSGQLRIVNIRLGKPKKVKKKWWPPSVRKFSDVQFLQFKMTQIGHFHGVIRRVSRGCLMVSIILTCQDMSIYR